MFFRKKPTGLQAQGQRAMYLVTGADRTHAASLIQFIRSAARHEPDTRLVVYDLGLTGEQRAAVLQENRTGSLEYFPYDRFPRFFDITHNSGEYAWKPAILSLEMAKSASPVCWMDAGSVIVGHLHTIRTELARIGFYCARSAGTVSEWTHPDMLTYLGLPPDWGGELPNLKAGCVAFDPSHPQAASLAREWAGLAEQKECIAPAGSDRSNHRQDQALLTVLAYRSGLISSPSDHGEFKTHRDVD